MKPSLRSISAAALSVLALTAATCAVANPVTTTLYYTTFGVVSAPAGGPTANVWTSSFSYDGSGTSVGVSYGTPTGIATTAGADGIVFNPNNGHLLVGGQGPRIHDLPSTGSPITTHGTSPVDVYHLAIDPGLGFVYGSGIPGGVAKVGISAAGFTGADTTMSISGSTSVITSLAFSGSSAFYTNASPSGPGQFGTATIGASSITTASTLSLTAAHGMIFDPFTGWLTLFGDGEIAQIDPASPSAVVASATLAGADFDQGTSDGLGHLWIASNNGNVTFIDLNSCTGGKVDASDCFVDTRFLISALDDMAPLAGLGGCAPDCNAPEPDSLALLVPAFAALWYSRRRRQTLTLTS